MEEIFIHNFRHAALIAPAGRVEQEMVDRGVELLENAGLQVTVMPHALAGGGEDYLAAALKGRLDDLHECWRDKSIDLIFCVRGGFGSAHLLPHINWNLLNTRKIPLVGYSDITALHMGMLARNVGIPVIAPMPVVFNKALVECSENEYTRNFMRLALSETIPAGTELTLPGGKGFNFIQSGYTLGRPVAANLSVLASLCGTPWFPRLRHRVLIIEELNEKIYRLDRYLTQLLQSGALTECAALFFGQFNNCGDAEDINKLLNRFAKKVKGPVIMDFPFGHDFPSISLNMRHHLRIEKNNKVFLIDT